MGFFSVLLPAIAALLFLKTGHTVLMVLAIVAAIGCLWSWGVMHNFATELAKRRADYSGGFYDVTPEEAQAVPNWIASLNMAFSLAGLVLLITGIVMIITR